MKKEKLSIISSILSLALMLGVTVPVSASPGIDNSGTGWTGGYHTYQQVFYLSYNGVQLGATFTPKVSGVAMEDIYTSYVTFHHLVFPSIPMVVK